MGASDISTVHCPRCATMYHNCLQSKYVELERAEGMRFLSFSGVRYVLSRKKTYLFLLFLLYMSSTSTQAQQITWWNLATETRLQHFGSFRNPELFLLSSQPLCTELQGLSAGQQKLCQLYQDHMGPIGEGARMAMQECKNQFRNRRWNCSGIEDGSMFRRTRPRASRETAFTYAISSAAVVYSISRACRQGLLSTCLCSKAPRPDNLNDEWEWGGCGDNVDYGARFAKEFVDANEMEINPSHRSREYATMKMNLHNNEAGRKALNLNIGYQCKCHGVSGSCNLKTCWREISPFNEIGQMVKEKYDSAAKVQVNKKGKLTNRHKDFNKPTRNDLVFLDNSPDYCIRNERLGTYGTQGRECNRTSIGTDGCDLMCCGRGFNVYSKEIVEKCKCKFKWCCYVKCKKCPKIVEVNVCK